MAGVTFLMPSDLTAFATIDTAKAQAMIEDAEAFAALAAPCLTTDEFLSDFVRVAAARAVLRGAVLRWNEAGAGAVQQQSAGPFQQTLDTRQVRRAMFWPSEIAALRDLCSTGSASAFSVDTVPSLGGAHLPWCSSQFGALYCSCGVDIAGEPIFELG